MKKCFLLFMICFGLIGCIRSPVFANEINNGTAVESSVSDAEDTILDFSGSAKLGDTTVKAVPIVPTPDPDTASGTWEVVFQPVLQRFAHFSPARTPDQNVLTNGYSSETSTSLLTLMINLFAKIAGFTVALVFMYWGIRKVTSAIMSAFKRGRLRI